MPFCKSRGNNISLLFRHERNSPSSHANSQLLVFSGFATASSGVSRPSALTFRYCHLHTHHFLLLKRNFAVIKFAQCLQKNHFVVSATGNGDQIAGFMVSKSSN
ncbi:MAG: hypothetical protein GPOALKHO_000105 [Sodalis sp.]|nr:MAG: hypothetical protein GPOALKHO_000105 [Sodalis sp.]